MKGDGIRQILQIGKRAGVRSDGEIGRKLSQLRGQPGIAARRRSLRGGLEIRRNLLCQGAVLGRTRLLGLFEAAENPREGSGAACACRRVARTTTMQQRLHQTGGEVDEWTDGHAESKAGGRPFQLEGGTGFSLKLPSVF